MPKKRHYGWFYFDEQNVVLPQTGNNSEIGAWRMAAEVFRHSFAGLFAHEAKERGCRVVRCEIVVPQGGASTGTRARSVSSS